MPETFDDNISIQFEQGQAGDCYLLTVVDCLRHLGFKDKEGEQYFKSLFKKNNDGSIEVTLNGGVDMSAKLIKPGMNKSEYEYKHDKEANKDWFKIPPEKLVAIKNDSKSSKSESIEILILERLVSYYIENWDQNINDSIDAHGTAQRNFQNQDSKAFLANLLGIQTFGVSNIDNVCNIKKYLPNQPIYISMEWGDADRNGNYHGRHALRIDEILYDSKGNPQFKLVNPWNNKERWYFDSEQLLKRRVSFNVFELGSKELEVVNDLSQNNPSQLNEDLQFLLFKAYPEKEYPDFYKAVANTTDTNSLKNLVYTHNKLTSYSKNLENYKSLVTVDPRVFEDIDRLQKDFLNYQSAPYNLPQNELKNIKQHILSCQKEVSAIDRQYRKDNLLDRQAMGFVETSQSQLEGTFRPNRANAAEFLYELSIQKKKQECYKVLRVMSKLGANVSGMVPAVAHETNIERLEELKKTYLKWIEEGSNWQHSAKTSIDFNQLKINDPIKTEIESSIIIPTLKRRIYHWIDKVHTNGDPEKAKSEVTTTMNEHNYGEAELRSLDERYSKAFASLQTCRASLKEYSQFASINPELKAFIDRYNLQINNTIETSHYEHLSRIEGNIKTNIDIIREHYIDECKKFEQFLGVEKEDYTNKDASFITGRWKALIVANDFYQWNSFINPTQSSTWGTQEYLLPLSLTKDDLNTLLENVPTLPISPVAADTITQRINERMDTLESNRVKNLDSAKRKLNLRRVTNNRKNLIQLAPIDFNGISDESQLKSIEAILVKLDNANNALRNCQESVKKLTNKEVPSTSLQVKWDDEAIDIKLDGEINKFNDILRNKEKEMQDVKSMNVILDLKKGIKDSIDKVHENLDPQKAKSEMTTAMNQRNYGEAELRSLDERYSKAFDSLQTCRENLQQYSQFASIDPALEADIDTFNLRINNTINKKDYEYLDTIAADIERGLDNKKVIYIARCEAFEQTLAVEKADYRNKDASFISQRWKALTVANDFYQWNAFINPTESSTWRTQEYLLPLSLTKDDLNTRLEKVPTLRISPAAADTITQRINKRIDTLESNRVKNFDSAKKTLNLRIETNNRKGLIRLDPIDFSGITEESQLKPIEDILTKLDDANHSLCSSQDKIRKLTKNEIPATSLRVTWDDKQIDSKLDNEEANFKDILEGKKEEMQKVKKINTDLVNNIQQLTSYYNDDNTCKKGVEDNAAKNNSSITEISECNTKLRAIHAVIQKTAPILDVIREYEQSNATKSPFSSSKADKAEKLKSAYFAIPLDCREKIFGDLKELNKVQKDSILAFRKELLTHRNIFNRIFHPVKQEKLEDMGTITSTIKLTSSFKKALEGCKDTSSDESNIKTTRPGGLG